MNNVLSNRNRHSTYGSMSNSNVHFRNKCNNGHPIKFQNNTASLDNVPECSNKDTLPSPSTGPPYPQEQSYPHHPPPAYPGEGTYIQPFTIKQKGPFGGAGINRSNDVEAFTMLLGYTLESIRRKFIRKVYLTLSIQLAITFGIVCLFTFVPVVGETVRKYLLMYYLVYGVFIVLYITLMCCEGV